MTESQSKFDFAKLVFYLLQCTMIAQTNIANILNTMRIILYYQQHNFSLMIFSFQEHVAAVGAQA